MQSALDDIWQGLVDALDDVGLEARLDREGHTPDGWDAHGEIEDVPVVIELKAAPTMADVARVGRRRAKDAYRVVAARRLSDAIKEELRRKDIGYYDGRGQLRLWHRPLLVDTAVRVRRDGDDRVERPLRIDSASMLDVALAVLDGSAASGVRSTADLLDRAPGTVSKQLARLRSAHLVDDDNTPLVPDLFEAVLEEWHPSRLPLAALPPRSGASSDRLSVRFDDLDQAGWVLADAQAAAAWGAPVVVAGDAPPDFYVPTQQIVRNARTLLGAAEFGQHACTVAVAPAPYVCRRRLHAPKAKGSAPAPTPVVAALDLAHDPARGRETLERWSRDLPEEVHRVW